jgi:uncharacterized protein (TIGR03435 family)
MAVLRIFLATAATAFAVLAAGINPSFEVATVKPSGSDISTRRFTIEGRRFLTFHTSLADLIQFAYGLHPRQLAGGPGWMESNTFDVVGLASGDGQPTEQEWMKMMANLIVERFHLRYHLEKRELAVYAITVDQQGSKLESSDGGPDTLPSLGFRGRGELVARNASIKDLAWELQSAVLDRPVVDQTGLAKRFHFTLSWTPDDFQTSALAGEARKDSEIAPNLFTAIREQLGLRLTATRSKADVMVVEQVTLPDRD